MPAPYMGAPGLIGAVHLLLTTPCGKQVCVGKSGPWTTHPDSQRPKCLDNIIGIGTPTNDDQGSMGAKQHFRK